MRLATLVGHGGLCSDDITACAPQWHHIIIGIGGHGDGYRHADLALLVGGRLSGEEFLIVVVLPPPPRGLPPCHGICHPRALHGNAGIGLGMSYDGDGIAILVGFLIGVYLHLESWPFVFLHAEVTTPVRCHDLELTGKSAHRQFELAVGLAELIGNHAQRLYLLPVAVAQRHVEGVAGNGLRLLTVVVHHADEGEIHRLAWPVDGPVGEEVHRLALMGDLGVLVRLRPHRLRRAVVVGLRIGLHITIIVILEVGHDFTPSIALQERILLFARPGLDFHIRTGKRFACSGAHHCHPALVAGQRLRNQVDIAHIEYMPVLQRPRGAHRLSLRLITLHVHQINTGGERRQHDGILENLIIGMTAVVVADSTLRAAHDFLDDLLQLFLVIQPEVLIGVCVNPPQPEGEGIEVTDEVHLYHMLLVGEHHLCVDTIGEARLYERLAGVFQRGDAGPLVILRHHAVDKRHLIAGGVIHPIIPQEGKFACLVEVAKDLKERVGLLYQPRSALRAFKGAEVVGGGNACCLAVALTLIVFL